MLNTKNQKIILSFFLALIMGNVPLQNNARENLTNLTNINIKSEIVSNKKELKKLIKNKKPKAIYIEQWIIQESTNKKLLKKLSKLAKKFKIKFYLVTGTNTWFGSRGSKNTIEVYDTYGKYIDGIVLRIEPNRTNVWERGLDFQVKVLNEMLDAYSSIYLEAKKRNKSFIAEVPFWLTDFQGPLESFSENVCKFADRIIFLIDDSEKLDKLEIKWNDVTCPYNINITKRATRQTEESIHKIYKKLKEKLTLYANFHGYIVDSDSTLEELTKIE